MTNEKISKDRAGYLELKGAKENAGCAKVQGWISTELGCCNLFEPKDDAVQQFKCGSCEYARKTPS